MTTIRDTDRGWKALRDLARDLKRKGVHAKVGLLDDGSREGTFTIAALGAVHEFGTAKIPERSFIRAGFDRSRQGVERIFERLLPGVYDGKIRVVYVLDVAGAFVANGIKSYVTKGPQVPPPNAPSTIRKKLARGLWRDKQKAKKTGRSLEDVQAESAGLIRTLIDTRRMVGSITWSVVTGGKP